MTAVVLGHVERRPLLDPCPVCACRSHTIEHHGELLQHDGQVMTEDELVARFDNPPDLYRHLANAPTVATCTPATARGDAETPLAGAQPSGRSGRPFRQGGSATSSPTTRAHPTGPPSP